MVARAFWLAVATAGIILTRTAPAGAQAWQAEWDEVVAGANAEGALVLDSQPNIEMRKYVQEEWAKAFPKIALSVSTTPGTQYLARIRTERSVDKYPWDVSVSSVTTAYSALPRRQLGLAKATLQDSRRQDLPSVSEPERQPVKGAHYLETQREERAQDLVDAIKFVSEIRKPSP